LGVRAFFRLEETLMAITSRGIRNNNPGNIDYNKNNQWQGQLPFDPAVESRFARFDTPENGIRALGKLLRTYQARYALYTVSDIIQRWAPASENDTQAYIDAVEQRILLRTGKPVAQLGNPDLLSCLVQAIIQHENGRVPYSAATIDEGVRRALL
jgi:hypothetical protein